MANILNRVRDNALDRNNNNLDEGVNIPDHDIDMEEEDLNDPLSMKTHGKSIHSSISDQALNTLNELRRSNLLCDAIITVADASFNVHRAIMSSCSSYFR